MSSPRFNVVVPARHASQRFFAKALEPILGKPLVVWCWEAAARSGADEVVVAVDHPSIAEAVERAGGRALMTSEHHASGTDRLAEAVDLLGWSDETIVVNLQGDEPLIDPKVLADLATVLAERASTGIATACTPIDEVHDLFAESVVKVVLGADGHALYFSRAPIPWLRGAFAPTPTVMPAGGPWLRHLGLYAYRARTLRALSAAEQCATERAESLEQLRALHLSIPIHVTVLPEAPPPGVDTPEDLPRVRAALESQGRT